MSLQTFCLAILLRFIWTPLIAAERPCEVRHGWDLSNGPIIGIPGYPRSNMEIASCRKACLEMPDCECWQFDPSRNKQCWLAKNGCTWKQWAETNDMTSGKCEIDIPNFPTSGVYIINIPSGLADATKNILSKQVNGGNQVTLYSASTPHADEQAVNKWIFDRTTAGGTTYKISVYGPQYNKKYLNVPELNQHDVFWELVMAGKDTFSGSQLYKLKKGNDFLQCHRSDGTCKVGPAVSAQDNTYVDKFVFSSADLHMPARQFMHISQMGHPELMLDRANNQPRFRSAPVRNPVTGEYYEDLIWEFIPIGETTQPAQTGYKYIRDWMFYIRTYHAQQFGQLMGRSDIPDLLDDVPMWYSSSVWILYFVGFEQGDSTRPMYYLWSYAQNKMMGSNANGERVFLGTMATNAYVYSLVLLSRPMPYPEDLSVFQMLLADPGVKSITGKAIGTSTTNVPDKHADWQHLAVYDETAPNLKNWVFRRVRPSGRRWVYRMYLDRCLDRDTFWKCTLMTDSYRSDQKVHNEQYNSGAARNYEFEFFYLGEDKYGNPSYRFRAQISATGQYVRAEPSGNLWHKPIGHGADRQSVWSLIPVDVDVLRQSFGKAVFGYSRPEFISSMKVKNWGAQPQKTSVQRSIQVSTTNGFEITEGFSYAVSLSVTNSVGGGTGAGTFSAETSVTVETSFEFSKSKTWSKETSKTTATAVQFELGAAAKSETEAVIRISRASVRIPFTIVYRNRKTNAIVTQRGYIRRENAVRVDVVVPPSKSLATQTFGTGKVLAVVQD